MFKLTEQEIKMLTQYAKVYDSERRTDATNTPIVLVQNRVKRYTSGNYSSDGRNFQIEINGYDLTEDGLAENETEVINIIKEYLSENDTDEKDITEIIDEIELKLNYIIPSDEIKIEKPIEITITVHHYEYTYETVAYFFTRHEAERYVKYQAHNLHNPRVYTAFSGFANDGDYPVFQKLLKRIGEHLITENKNSLDL